MLCYRAIRTGIKQASRTLFRVANLNDSLFDTTVPKQACDRDRTGQDWIGYPCGQNGNTNTHCNGTNTATTIQYSTAKQTDTVSTVPQRGMMIASESGQDQSDMSKDSR